MPLRRLAAEGLVDQVASIAIGFTHILFIMTQAMSAGMEKGGEMELQVRHQEKRAARWSYR